MFPCQWGPGHDDRTCEEFEMWKYMNENREEPKNVADYFDRTQLGKQEVNTKKRHAY